MRLPPILSLPRSPHLPLLPSLLLLQHDIREMITSLAFASADEEDPVVQDLLNAGFQPIFSDLVLPRGALWYKTEGGMPLTGLGGTADSMDEMPMMQSGTLPRRVCVCWCAAALLLSVCPSVRRGSCSHCLNFKPHTPHS